MQLLQLLLLCVCVYSSSSATDSLLSFNLCILGFPLSLLRQYSIDALKELENSLHVHELCFKDTKNILKVFSFVLLLLDKATVEIDP